MAGELEIQRVFYATTDQSITNMRNILGGDQQYTET